MRRINESTNLNHNASIIVACRNRPTLISKIKQELSGMRNEMVR